MRLTSSKKCVTFFFAGLLVVVVLAYRPFTHLVLASRLMLAIKALAAGATGEQLPVTRTSIERRMGDRRLQAFVYRPTAAMPERAVMLLAGVSELGCHHPRLVALSRTLAVNGFLVLTPDIEMFRRFEVKPSALDEILFWHRQTVELEKMQSPPRAGIIGISFSGTLALIASGHPEIRDSLAYVVAIGPYENLKRCARGWFAAGPRTVGEGYYPTRFYGKWIIMLAALEMIERDDERKYLQDVLIRLLLQKPPPPPGESLGPQARNWYRLATTTEDQTDIGLARAMETYLEPLYRELSPDKAAARVRCPVFVAHGAFDDLIPPRESEELYTRITGAKAYLLISPFLTHTHPLEKELGWGEKTRAVWNLFWFFYPLARAIQ